MTAPSYQRRELRSLVGDALETLPVVVVTGLRQAGKTTFLQNESIFSGRRFFTLDDFATLEAARAEPEALIEGDDPVTIDEAQRCPDLLVAIKRSVDRRRRPGRFLLSGSANLALMSGISESLAGRALYLTLHPFTRRESLPATSAVPFIVRLLEEGSAPKRHNVTAITESEVLAGGMPSVVLGEARHPELWFLGYEQTYLERDVRELSQVADLVTFRNLMRLAALRTAQVLNISEIGRDAKLPASTTSRYLGLLETSFVIARLAPFLRSRSTRLIKSPKLFVTDSGLAGHLTGVTALGAGEEEPLRGALYETYAHQNLAAILGAHLPRAHIGFWNVQGRHEVDFIVAEGRRCVAIEVKAATRFRNRDLAGLRAFMAKTSGCVAAVLAYNGRETVALGDQLFAAPLAAVLS